MHRLDVLSISVLALPDPLADINEYPTASENLELELELHTIRTRPDLSDKRRRPLKRKVRRKSRSSPRALMKWAVRRGAML
jgi:hypothetical protein